MTSARPELIFAGRGDSDGVLVRTSGGRVLLQEAPKKALDDSRSPGLCRVLRFSPDGAYLAFCDGRQLKLLPVQDNMGESKPVLVEDLPRTTQIVYSPRSTYLASFQPFAVRKDAEPQGEPNLRIFNISTGKLLKTFIQKKGQVLAPTFVSAVKRSERVGILKGWQPQWSDDESVMCRLVGSEVLFHTNDGGGLGLEKYSAKYVGEKVETVSLSPGPAPFHFAIYKPVTKGQPGIISLLQYPDMSIVANKTFWKADRVSMHWNSKGTAVIVMAITDVDSTGQSYYGEQTLYLIGTNGESCLVPLGKNGPVYSVAWSPRANGFCVVYGYMPAKATLYNVKGEPVFDFGTGARNEVHYNAFGTILCLCGFGNLRGNMEFWSVRERRLIKQTKAEDTTQFAWAPDGEHFITATTAPRLRVNNGWKVWRYTGQVEEEWKAGEGKEFWEATWCPNPLFTVEDHKVEFPAATPPVSPSQAATNPMVVKGAYVPPHLRGDKAAQARAKKFAIHENEKPMRLEQGRGKPVADGNAPVLTAAEERAKKIRNVQKKLEAIKVLKKRQADGETLELNQLTKMEKEAELVKELENLELS